MKLGVIEQREDQPAEAVKHFEKAIALNEDQAEVYFMLGRGYKSLGRDREAKEAFAKGRSISRKAAKQTVQPGTPATGARP